MPAKPKAPEGKYMIFLSAPDDMDKEKTVVKEVIKFQSERWAATRNIEFEVETGDTIMSIGHGNAIENIIDNLEKRQNNFLLYIGLIGTRFGTPTRSDSAEESDSAEDRYPSGTYAEFLHALKKKNEDGHPEIKFFFKNSAVSIARGDREARRQLDAVEDFHDRIKDSFGLGYFDSLDDLEQKLDDNLTRWFKDHFREGNDDTENPIDPSTLTRIADIKDNLLFQHAPVLLCFTDPNASQGNGETWRFTEINEKIWEDILGYPDKNALDDRILELENRESREEDVPALLYLIHPGDREETQKEMGQLFLKGTQKDFANRYIHNDYSYRWIKWRSKLMAGQDGPIIYSIGVDITSHYIKSKLYDNMSTITAGKFESPTGDELVEKLAEVFGEIIEFDIFLLNISPKENSLEGDNIVVLKSLSEDNKGVHWKKEKLEISGDIFLAKGKGLSRSIVDEELSDLIDVEKLKGTDIMKDETEIAPLLYFHTSSELFVFTLCFFLKKREDGGSPYFDERNIALIKNFGLETYLNALQRRRLSEPMQKLFRML